MKGNNLESRSAFTLIEMLLVLFIMGLVASATLMVFDSADDEQRYRKTADRLEIIKRSILGTKRSTTLNSTPIIDGFIADMGRLPIKYEGGENHEFLKELYDGASITGLLSSYVYIGSEQVGDVPIPNISIMHGWRGPYLDFVESELRDGWGHVFQYGMVGSDMTLQSFGKDGSAGGTENFEQDYPNQSVIEDSLYKTNDVSISVTLKNNTLNSTAMHLGIIYPGIDIDDDFTDHNSVLKEDISIDSNQEETFTISYFPTDFIRKFQFVLYNTDVELVDSLRNRINQLNPQVYYLVPQTTSALTIQMDINIWN